MATHETRPAGRSVLCGDTDGEGEYVGDSAAHVRAILARDGERTHGEITDETRFNPRTVRRALGRLKEEGVVVDRVDPGDPRRRLYRLHGTDRRRYAAESDD